MAQGKCKDCRYFRKVVSAIWCAQGMHPEIKPEDKFECYTEPEKIGVETYKENEKK